ncbi:unnamed protein product, partial [Brenthis ino]
MAFRLLNIKFEEADDVNLHQYSKLKWRLITSWFNLLTATYLPICIYCDWCTLKQKHQRKHVKLFSEVRTFMFTNLIFPVTTFADILFWRLWFLNRELLMPLSTDKVIAVWEHHSMHTASLIFVFMDLVIVFRERPKNILPGVVALLGFITVYTCVCVFSLLNGEYVYPLLKLFKGHKLFIITLYSYLSLLFYHSGQWIIVDLIHNRKYITKKLM